MHLFLCDVFSWIGGLSFPFFSSLSLLCFLPFRWLKFCLPYLPYFKCFLGFPFRIVQHLSLEHLFFLASTIFSSDLTTPVSLMKWQFPALFFISTSLLWFFLFFPLKISLKDLLFRLDNSLWKFMISILCIQKNKKKSVKYTKSRFKVQGDMCSIFVFPLPKFL